MAINTLDDLKAAVKQAGSHFFDPDTMRFFDSRILLHVYPTARGNVYFVTSERFHGSGGQSAARMYTVRYFDGRSVFSVQGFQAHASAARARAAARIFAGEGDK